MKKTLPVIFLVALAGAAGYVAGRYIYRLEWKNYRPGVVFNESVPAHLATQKVDLSKFWTVWGKVSDNYVNKAAMDPGKMVEGAIYGLVSSLGDPYTVYLSREQNQAEKDSLGGTFEGVGIQLGYKDSKLVVVTPIDGTPAKLAGIRAGDLIARIKDVTKNIDRDTTGIALPEAVALIRGPKGTRVELTLLRESQPQPVVVNLNRDTILIRSVELQMHSRVAWLKLTRFGDRTQEEWDVAIASLVSQGSSLKGIVLDLRNNPGGYLGSSVYTASEFLSKGKVVVAQRFGDGTSREDKVTRKGKLLKTPLVVLVNEGSASAAEIMAGALQDHKRAKIVGVKTFGKGSVQQPENLADGSGLHITIAKWLTPSGEWIDKNGIVPDVLVKLDPDKVIASLGDDDQLQAALQLF